MQITQVSAVIPLSSSSFRRVASSGSFQSFLTLFLVEDLRGLDGIGVDVHRGGDVPLQVAGALLVAPVDVENFDLARRGETLGNAPLRYSFDDRRGDQKLVSGPGDQLPAPVVDPGLRVVEGDILDAPGPQEIRHKRCVFPVRIVDDDLLPGGEPPPGQDLAQHLVPGFLFEVALFVIAAGQERVSEVRRPLDVPAPGKAVQRPPVEDIGVTGVHQNPVPLPDERDDILRGGRREVRAPADGGQHQGCKAHKAKNFFHGLFLSSTLLKTTFCCLSHSRVWIGWAGWIQPSRRKSLPFNLRRPGAGAPSPLPFRTGAPPP